MKRITYLLAVVVVGLVGCEGEEKKTKEKEQPPPPPSAQQLHKANSEKLMQTIASNPGNVQSTVSEIKSSLRREPNGAEALNMITSDVREGAKQAYAAAEESGEPILWESVLVLCDALEALNPDDPRIGRYRERAKLEKQRPMVRLNGFMTDPETDTDIAIIDVSVPGSGETKRMNVQEGEEFMGLEFVEVIGNREGMVLKYKPTGKEYRVKN